MTARLTVHHLAVHLPAPHLSPHLSPQKVVKDTSFTLEAGAVLGITGASGSGKSMTGFALMGLLPEGAVSTGAIHLDGDALNPGDDEEMTARRGVDLAMVFQEPMTALNPMMTIGDQVAEMFRHHRHLPKETAQDHAREVLERVGLGHISPKRHPHELSGGQRQRVAIAMAIALKPKVLIADEPTTALDTTTQKSILNLLKRLVREDHMAMILITHDLAVMAEMADDILVMEKGQVTSTGPVAMMLSPEDPVLAQLIAASLPSPQPRPAAPSSAPSSTPSSAPLLKLEGIGKSYSTPSILASLFSLDEVAPALDGVSTVIHRGECLGLVGRSGCGKSTLSRIGLALAPADDGAVTFADTAITPATIPAELRPKLSAVFQDPYGSFNPRMTIGELVAEPLRLMSPPPVDMRHAVYSALAAVGIDPSYSDRRIHQCSGGERQRIAFARATITRPDLIILDEPVSALDAPHRRQVLAEMTRLGQELGIATMLISHDLSVVRSFCPRVMVMAEGRIVEDGPTAAIFDNPRHPETQRLIAAMPDLERALTQLTDEPSHA